MLMLQSVRLFFLTLSDLFLPPISRQWGLQGVWWPSKVVRSEFICTLHLRDRLVLKIPFWLYHEIDYVQRFVSRIHSRVWKPGKIKYWLNTLPQSYQDLMGKTWVFFGSKFYIAHQWITVMALSSRFLCIDLENGPNHRSMTEESRQLTTTTL